MTATIIIDRNDIKNELHEFLFDDWCRELGLNPEITDSFEVSLVTTQQDIDEAVAIVDKELKFLGVVTQ